MLNKLRVLNVTQEHIEFEGGVLLYSHHSRDCCESHYLSMQDLTMKDFEDLEFDLREDDFFRRIDGYGIELIPINGHSVKIPGYGYNNGYYSSNLDLILETPQGKREYNISDCQDITG